MSMRPGSKVSPGRSICLTWSVKRTVRASATELMWPLSSMKIAGCSTYVPLVTSSMRSAVTTVAAEAGAAIETAATAASRMVFTFGLSPKNERSNVQDPPVGGKHGLVHHFAERRVREDGLDKVVVDQLGGL